MPVTKKNISATIDIETAEAISKLATLKNTVYHKRSFSQLVDMVAQKGMEAINKELKKIK